MYGQPMYYNNPMMQTAQQRLQMMESQYPQFSGNPSPGYGQPGPYTGQAAQSGTVLKGRPVSNIEEANAAMIDFDGSLFVFPDKAHGKIYTKQLGLDGNIIFNVYTQENPAMAAPPAGMQPQPQPQPVSLEGYVRTEDLERVLTPLQEKINKLEQRASLNQSKGGNKQ